MPITVNLRHLEKKVVNLEGEISPQELEFTELDELIKVEEPLEYEIQVERSGNTLLLTGRLNLLLECECARCLKPFQQVVEIDPWTAQVPLDGEEAAPVNNDLVDLTPVAREDLLLEIPSRPLCSEDCHGLTKPAPGRIQTRPAAERVENQKSAWSALDKLKFNE